MTQYIILLAYLLFINVLAFILFGIDKRHAVNHLTRIPEAILLWMARLGGGLGCILGMYLLHHKKKKPQFLFRVPLWIIIWMFVLVLFVALTDGGNLVDDLRALNPRG